MLVSDIGYALNSLGYLLLLLLLLAVRKSGLAKHLLVLATMGTLAWSLSMLSYFAAPWSAHYLLVVDTARHLFWLLFIAGCLKNDFANLWQVLRRPATSLIVAPPLFTLFILLWFQLPASWSYLLLTVLSLEVLILLEVMFRQAGDNQWAFKPLVVYLGATQVFDFVMYANATMVSQIEFGYVAARGFIHLFLLPFLVIATKRIKHWGIDIFISRDVVLHSSLLLVAGAYLFVMAVIGYAINYLGGSWSSTIQLVLVVLSLVLLATLVLSNQVRTRIKVFITKHFFANQFDYREEWVKLTHTLSQTVVSTNEVYRQGLTGILNALNYQQGLLLKTSRWGAEPVAAIAIDAASLSSTEREIAERLLAYCQKTGWQIDLQEYLSRPFHYEGLQLAPEDVTQCRFQLLLPLYRDNQLWGAAFIAAGEQPKVSLNWEIRDYLKAVTEQVGSFIYHHEASQEVAENAQFAAFNRMSAFVLHDLKNVLAQIDLILCNAEQHRHNPEFIDDTFETLVHSKQRMEKMLRELNEKKVVESNRHSACLLSPLVKDVIDHRCASLRPTPTVITESETAIVVDGEKFANVIYHLLNNAQQATPDDGTISVKLVYDEPSGTQTLLICDSGCGMDKDFIAQRLFKPFDTTKGNAGMGIGAYDAKQFMQSIGGHLAVESEVGRGTCFTLSFPV